ncbi:MAG: SURF1 family protein, partial [Gammaproteobacteria bacterium]|nr:SURF1 family protein [Gemmatimonadota bacterium]NIU72235.1 SURF1 family protein [Gammaproteobacteria bacterium]
MSGTRPLDVTPAGVLGSIAVLVVAAVCVRLGFWQLDRLQERRDRNAVVEARMAMPPVALAGLPSDTAGLVHRRVTLAGGYDHAHDLVLAGRSMGGLPGVYLYSPLRLGTGAVLVERGWLPSAD